MQDLKNIKEYCENECNNGFIKIYMDYRGLEKNIRYGHISKYVCSGCKSKKYFAKKGIYFKNLEEIESKRVTNLVEENDPICQVCLGHGLLIASYFICEHEHCGKKKFIGKRNIERPWADFVYDDTCVHCEWGQFSPVRMKEQRITCGNCG